MGISTGIGIKINIILKGEALIKSLEKTLKKLRAETINMSAIQRRVNVDYGLQEQALRRSNATLLAKTRLTNDEVNVMARRLNTEQELTFSINNRMSIEKAALITQRHVMVEGKQISIESARVMVTKNNEIIASEQAVAEATRIKTQALMRTSISMFVLNISMGQLVTSMKPFTKGNEDAEKAVDDLSGALQFSMAPLQAYMSLQMISTSLAEGQKAAFLGVATSLGAIFFMYQAITAQSPKMRAAYAAIATVLTAVSIASWVAAYGTAALKAALTSNYMAIVAVTAALALAVGAVAYASAPHAQTEPGQRRRIEKTGLAVVHAGEIWRPKAGGDGEGGGTVNNIYLPSTYRGTVGESRYFAREVERLTRSGQSSSNYSKVVVAGG